MNLSDVVVDAFVDAGRSILYCILICTHPKWNGLESIHALHCISSSPQILLVGEDQITAAGRWSSSSLSSSFLICSSTLSTIIMGGAAGTTTTTTTTAAAAAATSTTMGPGAWTWWAKKRRSSRRPLAPPRGRLRQRQRQQLEGLLLLL